MCRATLIALVFVLAPWAGRAAEEPRLPVGTLILEGQPVRCHFESSYSIVCGDRVFEAERLEEFGSRAFWIDVAISVGLVMGAATAAGLTMGLMSQDNMNLEILLKSGTPEEQHHASRILPLVKQHHLLLVTLLLVNACCNEALPLFLDELMHPVTNIIVSVTALLLFGEIIPQALCTRYGLAIGSCAAPVVWTLIFLTWLISYPIAKLLDCCLGHGSHPYYRRAQLKELVDIHGHIEGQCEEALSPDECLIIRGALDLKNKTVEDCLTPIEDVFMLSHEGVLDFNTMTQIYNSGHSRVPVFLGSKEPREDEAEQKYQIVGMILMRNLIMVSPEAGVPVKSIPLQSVPIVPTTKPLYDMLNMFQEGRSHLAVVVDSRDHLTYRGIITLEDVFEALIQEPIEDEMDLHRHMVVSYSYRQVTEGSQYGGRVHSGGPGPVSMGVSQRVSVPLSITAKPEGKGRLAVRQLKETDTLLDSAAAT